mmetsp:Transcript_107981/g.311230  ORF Transcript_107981/g.311230 Transcript_107981/m.311230 type:complete len:227 (+) Transcript_107981:2512-3192(+)
MGPVLVALADGHVPILEGVDHHRFGELVEGIVLELFEEHQPLQCALEQLLVLSRAGEEVRLQSLHLAAAAAAPLREARHRGRRRLEGPAAHHTGHPILIHLPAHVPLHALADLPLEARDHAGLLDLLAILGGGLRRHVALGALPPRGLVPSASGVRVGVPGLHAQGKGRHERRVHARPEIPRTAARDGVRIAQGAIIGMLMQQALQPRPRGHAGGVVGVRRRVRAV